MYFRFSGYPQFATMREIIANWNPDEVNPPKSFAKYDSLLRLDYQNEAHMELALKLRNAELPFITYNIPNINDVVQKWTDEYLDGQLGSSKVNVDTAENNHMLYWSGKGSKLKRGGAGENAIDNPQQSKFVTYNEFKEYAQQMPDEVEQFWYFQTGSGAPGMNFVMDDMTCFNPRYESFFIVDTSPGAYRGIHCRFGAAGIIAESHYDGHRNFIAMLRGHKRYILNPPDQCGNLGLFDSGPSARHTFVDFSEPNKPSRGYHQPAPPEWYTARGIDTVLNEGDVLYVPSFYFHNPISLDRSIQCNARSGISPLGQHAVEACGFRSGHSSEDALEAQAIRDDIASGKLNLDVEGAEPPGGKLTLAGAVIQREGGRKAGVPREGPGDPLLPIPGESAAAADDGSEGSTMPAASAQGDPATVEGASAASNKEEARAPTGQLGSDATASRAEAWNGRNAPSTLRGVASQSEDGGIGDSPGMMAIVGFLGLAVIFGVYRLSRGRG